MTVIIQKDGRHIYAGTEMRTLKVHMPKPPRLLRDGNRR